MKPQPERVDIPEGCSIRVLHRRMDAYPFEWHYHPGVWELSLALNSRGWRFVADHVSAYDSHDLLLVPPEMPHARVSVKPIDQRSPHVAVVLWFSGQWASQLADTCREYSSIRRLLQQGTAGLSFAAPAGHLMEARLPGLLSNSERERLQTALDVLSELAECEAEPLAMQRKEQRIQGREPGHQFDQVLDILHERFAEPIRMRDLCAVANVSERSLHRLFLRHVGQGMTDYLSRLRIARACVSLVETDRPINVIAEEVGFSNLSNFNRLFRALRQMSPRECRRFYRVQQKRPEPFGSGRSVVSESSSRQRH